MSVLANMTCTEEKKTYEAQYRSKILQNMEIIVLQKGSAFHFKLMSNKYYEIKCLQIEHEFVCKTNVCIVHSRRFEIAEKRNGT